MSEANHVLVMLGGFPDTHDMWRGVIDEFGESYAMLSLPTPDFDRGRLRRKLGYSPSECTDMIEAAIEKALGPSRAFDLLVHDWGCVWGYEYAARRPERVRKMCALDVGPITGINAALEKGRLPKLGDVGTQRGAPWMLPYQLSFAFIFWLGARVHPLLANLAMFGLFLLAPLLGPMNVFFKYCTQLPRPLTQVRWWMTYPYFQMWVKHVLALKPLAETPLVPAAPLLYAWGERKHCMFHTEEFVRALEATPGCRAVSFDCSHWLMHERPAELHAEMRAFLLGDDDVVADSTIAGPATADTAAPSDDVTVDCDYLVVGAGLSGMGFVDSLLEHHDDARVVDVDRYEQCGGHWTLAYPFVSLYTPAMVSRACRSAGSKGGA